MIARAFEGLPPWLLVAWLGALGLVVGSFLNVVVHRIPRRQSVVWPRSSCPSCGRVLPWHENVPVLSWLALRGRCSGCGTSISPRYLVLEVATCVVVVGAHARFGLTLPFVVAVILSCLLLALVFIDLEHLLLPDALTLPGAACGLLLSPWNPFVGGGLLDGPGDALLGALLGAFIVEWLNLAYKVVRGRDGFGAGDTKMLVLIGAFLGWKLVLLCLVLASILGAGIGIPVLALARRRQRAEAEGGAEESPSEPELADESAPAPGSSGLAALADALPRSPVEALGPATYVLLALSLLPDGRPDVGVPAFLAGVALALVLRRAFGERSYLAATAVQWPMLGALAGLPPGAVRGAGAVLCAGLVIAAWSRPLPAPPSEREDEVEIPAGPGLMSAALPFGVFLGLGGLAALFFGEDLIAWYAGLLAPGR